MALSLDSEILPVLLERAEAAAGIVLPGRGDALGLRALTDAALAQSLGALPAAPDVRATHHTATNDGVDVPLRWYEKPGSSSGAAVVYVHGGGMICGTLENYEPLARSYVDLTGVPVLLVGYRLAPENHGSVPAEDSFAALAWLVEHSAELGVDPSRIALMGDSGGGGVGAGAAILARDSGIPLARQILVYPMLDDRNVEPDPNLAPTATWSYDNNYTGWRALLGDQLGGPDVPAVAAPARLTEFAGLAPAYIEVGELDIFRDEGIAYATNLLRAGVSCELHVHPGAPHSHDTLAPAASVSRRSVADRVRVISAL